MTRITLNCCSVHRSRRMHHSSSRVKASSAPKGSSSSSIFGSWISARQMRRALLHAARELPRELVLVAAEADLLQQLAARCVVFVALRLEAASGRARRSPAAAARCRAWCARAAATAPGRPCREIFSGPVTGCAVDAGSLPRDGIFSPVVSFMKVDLPQPEGPDDGDELALVRPSGRCPRPRSGRPRSSSSL